MGLNPIYLHVSNDVVCCTSQLNTNQFINRIEQYCGFNFIYKETAVTQGTGPGNNDHVAVGLQFRDPIGGGDNYPGSINFNVFKNHFNNVIRQKMTRSGVKKPIFAIVDHNSAHHFSYALPYLMFKNIGRSTPNRRKLFISFDNHTDQHDHFGTYIRCGNYVKALFSDHVVDYVMHIGWDSNGNHNFQGSNLFDINNYRVQTTRENNNADPKINVNHTLLQSLQHVLNRGVRYVYISIDRDFMKGACTPYPDRECSPIDTARLAVNTVMTTLSNSAVILLGMDITGLPCIHGNSASLAPINLNALNTSNTYPAIVNLNGPSANHTKALKVALHDIKYYYSLAINLVRDDLL